MARSIGLNTHVHPRTCPVHTSCAVPAALYHTPPSNAEPSLRWHACAVYEVVEDNKPLLWFQGPPRPNISANAL
ncbi:uncharacterized protein TRAVEDRAFT_29396 [Trametes versicolor FP-101664 SS1]|uniref:uncharacterized protein n=1 Tax=Trametes versicolor (strain FP-101664) TaxID=717944 RepID=UPI000462396D|nr:uncharacterized protein TRAVEDRAFT_29396 [Trametes versicolor FP-101664 SS1]EIW57232.1 hypothetical protein TRAVEDRAFT_29396 [Trametes versicolor FP-101664 SS1]